MSAQHTPGPWRIGKVASAIVADTPPDDMRSADEDEYYGGHLVAESIQVRDRPLICAAPDLLALARSIQRWLMTDAEPSHIGAEDMRVYHLDGGVLGNLLDECRTAIAKAEGK